MRPRHCLRLATSSPLRTNDGSESGMVELEWARLVRDREQTTGGEDVGVSDMRGSILGTN